MVNLDQFTSDLARYDWDLSFFKLIMLYEKDVENINCYDSITKIKENILNNINLLKSEFSEKIENILKNDFKTFVELVNEFKDYVYPKYPVDVMCMLSNLKSYVLDNIYTLLSKNPYISRDAFLNQLNIFLKTIPDAHFVCSFDDNAFNDLDRCIGIIRNKAKSYASQEMLSSFYDVLGLYFGYKMGQSHV